MANTLPDAVQRLLRYSETLIAFAKAPALFIRKRVVSFIVGVVASLASATGAIGRDALGSVAGAFQAAADPLSSAIGNLYSPIVDLWIGVNVGVANVATDVLGPAAPIVVVGFVILQVAAVIRAIPPALIALSDVVGAVPIIGTAIDGLATFALEYLRGGSDS